MATWGSRHIAGTLLVTNAPNYFDFEDLRLTPSETRRALALKGRNTVLAFSTDRPFCQDDEELTKRAAQAADATLFLHPIEGLTRIGDIRYYARVRTYKVLADRYYDAERVVLGLQPLATRMAGPREALWRALVARNYGASHFICESDPANPGLDSHGRPFYRPYEAQGLLERHGDELGVGVVPLGERPHGSKEVERQRGEVAVSAEWSSRPEVAEIVAAAHPPRPRQGVCVWFTGLSAAGKSTTANALTSLLLECGRKVTVLDGDVVRTHLSRGLGFSKQDRDANVLRIGFVAAEVVRHGGIAVCAAVSPYRNARDRVRELVGADQFLEVFVDASLEVCEARDAKGMYARARRGEIAGFTGIDDPYEAPLRPDIVLDSVAQSARQNARLVLMMLAERGFVRPAI
jgi:sulfate adenylyltransferase